MEDGKVPGDIDAAASAAAKPRSCGKSKDRHIVSWSQQDDDILREQVAIHGTENWTCIAAQFKDKTSRQCRRRWYTYLNTECKKGGWSPEEDMILCEAQKIFGNRWTEISKVVSGRTDNAVKNRFNTLCKKRAKNEILSKDNDSTSSNFGDGKTTLPEGSDTNVASESSTKKIRSGSLEDKENLHGNNIFCIKNGIQEELLSPPLATLTQNVKNVACVLSNHLNANYAASSVGETKNMTKEPFIKTDDPRVTALMQQADLLSSLAQKINVDNSDQSREDAWKELHNYLIKMGECGSTCSELSEIDSLLGNLKELEDLSCNMDGDIVGAESSSSIHASKENEAANYLLCHSDADTMTDLPQVSRSSEGKGNNITILSLPKAELRERNASSVTSPNSAFHSPLQMVPLFHSLTEVIPSPKFSASERHFLLSILGLSSPSSNAANLSTSQQPSCKRALLHSL